MYRYARFAPALVLALAASFAASITHAAGGVTVALTANRVTQTQGRESLAPAEQAHPGETLEYRAVYHNAGEREARGLAATLPIPPGTHYVLGTASPGRVEASLDGHTFAPVPLTRRERTTDGRTVVRTVPASEYRALRWPLGVLASSKARAVSARVRIQATEVTALTH
jgi:uncharacterized repeat protein (TIGR01451 family)